MKKRGKKKKIKRNEDNLRDLWDNGKCQHSNHRSPRRRQKETILKEIIVENFPKMGKEIATQVQETQRVPKG